MAQHILENEFLKVTVADEGAELISNHFYLKEKPEFCLVTFEKKHYL